MANVALHVQVRQVLKQPRPRIGRGHHEDVLDVYASAVSPVGVREEIHHPVVDHPRPAQEIAQVACVLEASEQRTAVEACPDEGEILRGGQHVREPEPVHRAKVRQELPSP